MLVSPDTNVHGPFPGQPFGQAIEGNDPQVVFLERSNFRTSGRVAIVFGSPAINDDKFMLDRVSTHVSRDQQRGHLATECGFVIADKPCSPVYHLIHGMLEVWMKCIRALFKIFR
ncbi:hypothetical protein D3C80_1545390 [compost metagenome]